MIHVKDKYYTLLKNAITYTGTKNVNYYRFGLVNIPTSDFLIFYFPGVVRPILQRNRAICSRYNIMVAWVHNS